MKTANPNSLTNEQQRVLDYAREFQTDRNRPPMLFDVMEECGIPTLTSVRFILGALHRKGRVEMDPECKRLLRVSP